MHAAFVVAQRPSYKAPTKFGSNSGLKGTGTGADPEEVQQKSQEIIRDLQVCFRPFYSTGAVPHTAPPSTRCMPVDKARRRDPQGRDG